MREKFEKLLISGKFDEERLSDFYDCETEAAWRGFQAGWQASRAAALEEALTAVIAERLEDPTKNPDDVAYDMAVDDCADAIRALAKDGGGSDA